MKKYMPISKEQFEDIFTEEEQKDIKGILDIYNEVNVVYENGKYHYSSMVICDSHYAPDHRFVGCVYADDIA